MTDLQVQAALSPMNTVALTVWAEARGDTREGHSSVEERIGVLCVIRNRAARRKQTWKHVCLAPSQFSCWQRKGGEANYEAVMALARHLVAGDTVHDALYLETAYLAEGVTRGVVLDRVAGADHYLTTTLFRTKPPTWANPAKVVAVVGGHTFLRLEG